MIWGIDIATRITGWTAGVGDVKPETGAFHYDPTGADYGLLLDCFDRDLSALADRFPPTVIIYEAPIKTQWDKLATLRRLYSMGAYLELWARRRAERTGQAIIVQEEDLRTLKTRLTGSHKSDKAMMVAMAQHLGITLPKGKAAEDAADSFAAWLVGIEHHAKQYLPAWDAAMYRRRGQLI